MPMQVILCEDVPNLGKTGEVVNVKPGFGRNYLIPRGLALTATSRNVRRLEHDKRVIEQQDGKRRRDAQSLKEKLEALSLSIAKNVGSDEKLFGSVTNREIADALKDEGIEIDRKVIELDQPIKALGVYTVVVKLAREVSANLKLWVVAK
jgi:large subunit ribosomal protein L9